jgi:phage shock protein A
LFSEKRAWVKKKKPAPKKTAAAPTPPTLSLRALATMTLARVDELMKLAEHLKTDIDAVHDRVVWIERTVHELGTRLEQIAQHLETDTWIEPTPLDTPTEGK